MPATDVVTWQDLLEECSRIHTTRTREVIPGWEEQREDSHMLDIFVGDVPAVVVPTRMHEPGFYVRSPNASSEMWVLRSPEQLEEFHVNVDAGLVRRRD